MRMLSISKFRANMVEEMKNLPLLLTKDGKAVAKVCTDLSKVCTNNVVTSEKFVQTSVKPAPKKGKFVQTIVDEASSFTHDPYFKPHTKEHQARKKAK